MARELHSTARPTRLRLLGFLVLVGGSVLAGNVTMLDMCRRLGFSVRSDADDPSVWTVTLDLRGR